MYILAPRQLGLKITPENSPHCVRFSLEGIWIVFIALQSLYSTIHCLPSTCKNFNLDLENLCLQKQLINLYERCQSFLLLTYRKILVAWNQCPIYLILWIPVFYKDFGIYLHSGLTPTILHQELTCYFCRKWSVFQGRQNFFQPILAPKWVSSEKRVLKMKNNWNLSWIRYTGWAFLYFLRFQKGLEELQEGWFALCLIYKHNYLWIYRVLKTVHFKL